MATTPILPATTTTTYGRPEDPLPAALLPGRVAGAHLAM
jgi:hypothetical protein